MSSQQTYRQELPPPGGYKAVQFARIPVKTFLNSWFMFGTMFVSVYGGAYIWGFNKRRNIMFDLEVRSARFALHPMLMAEKDRAYLLQLRKNRDEEERLMANVPGWIVGTLFGEPIYKTRPKDEWVDVSLNEFYAQASFRDFNRYLNLHKYH